MTHQKKLSFVAVHYGLHMKRLSPISAAVGKGYSITNKPLIPVKLI